MSGGSLNYFYTNLEEHIGDFGDKELDDLIRDLTKLFKAREWYLSADTNEGTWRDKRDAFKRKWFSPVGRRERIDKYLDEIRNDVLESFGLSDRRCSNCRHWKKEPEKDSPYGFCNLGGRGCLMHRSESCEKFEKGCEVG